MSNTTEKPEQQEEEVSTCDICQAAGETQGDYTKCTTPCVVAAE